MANNLSMHAPRITKIRAGFAAASVPLDHSTRLLEMFDTLLAEQATELAKRSEFSVYTHSKIGYSNGEDRREMTRALLFIHDLQYLFEEKSLPAKKSDEYFKELWQGDEPALKISLRNAAKALFDDDMQARTQLKALQEEIRVAMNIVVPKRPPLILPKINFDEVFLSRLRQTVNSQSNRIVDSPASSNVINVASVAWSNAKTRQLQVFTTKITNFLSNMQSIDTAATLAYEEFKKFFEDQACAEEAKIAMARKMFGAIAEHAPFPLSIVGKIGDAACGLAHVDKTISQTRQVGGKQFFNSDIPTLEKFSAKFEEVKDWGSDLTKVGVHSSAVPNGASISQRIESAKMSTIKAMISTFEKSVFEVYGDTPSEMANTSTSFFRNLPNPIDGPYRGLHPAGLSQVVINKITALSDATIQTLDAWKMDQIESETLQPFIELQLIAVFMAQKAPKEKDFDGFEIPDALIRRLENDPFKLISRKTGSSKSTDIFQKGMIPWAGNIRHIGAIVLFFRWYGEHVNPFLIATGTTSAQDVRKNMRSMIELIGKKLDNSRIKRRLRDDTADWAVMSKELNL
ncbi:hypothetical protein [Limnohabitans sp. Rim8]|uniref:hypothetical protein n=1 Tax=Limnohabitans sp. Rim8 TaxID=1100718 RepID=UPI0025D73D46|nr:hypothetical protein [Limnohabitans sp. Rim8]